MGATNHWRRLLASGSGCPLRDSGEPLLYRFYYQMFFIRRFEEKYLLPYAQCSLSNKSQASLGLEVCDVGAINALDSARDFIFSTYRTHGHFIAYSDDISGFSSVTHSQSNYQYLHRFNTCGRGGEGNLLHQALDEALACKSQGTGAICAVFLERDTVDSGLMQEIGNLSSLWSLPVLFVLTDDGTMQKKGRSTGKPEDYVVNGFECASQLIVADDVLKVYAFASAAVAYVRNNGSPFLLRLQTEDGGARQGGQEEWPADRGGDEVGRDPLHKIARQLTPQARELIEAFVEERIEEALEGAWPK